MGTNITDHKSSLFNWDSFFKKAFSSFFTKKPHNIPENIKNASMKICMAYDIKGICDPMYIVNTIAKELNLGDGFSNFF